MESRFGEKFASLGATGTRILGPRVPLYTERASRKKERKKKKHYAKPPVELPGKDEGRENKNRDGEMWGDGRERS